LSAFFVDELGFTDYQIIYDSAIDSFDTRTFNSKVLHKENILCLMLSNDAQFGFFQKEKMKNLTFGAHLNQSREFLIFSFKSTQPEPILLTRKQQYQYNSITTYSNSERHFLFTVHSCFWLTTEGKVHIHQMLKDYYCMNFNVINPFANTLIGEKIAVNRLCVLQLSYKEYL
jgi:hypothetical protein